MSGGGLASKLIYSHFYSIYTGFISWMERKINELEVANIWKMIYTVLNER